MGNFRWKRIFSAFGTPRVMTPDFKLTFVRKNLPTRWETSGEMGRFVFARFFFSKSNENWNAVVYRRGEFDWIIIRAKSDVIDESMTLNGWQGR